MPRSGAAPTRDHTVLFYDRAAHAVDHVADYVGEGLSRGEGVVAVLTPPHASALEVELRSRGHNLDGARAEGRFVVLDAADALQTFLVGGIPDGELLADGVGGLIAELGVDGRPVRGAGEMVAVLWDEGNVAGALALESAWNELADALGFSLLCPYPASVLEAGHLTQVGQLCSLHSDVVPPEAYASGPDGVDGPSGAATGVFVPTPEAVGATRRLVAGAIADWSATRGLVPDDFLVADACLVASEMAANAVKHAQSAFEVTVTCAEDAVRVSVCDTGAGVAETHHVGLLDLGGRGLAIVDDVADRWGCDTVARGKVVWAELTARHPIAL
ncbi:MAG: MEDS domain-containing protein [Lapillicoccus sp.]